VTKYISGLKYAIQKRLILHDMFFVNEAHNKAMKIERLQSRAPPFRPPSPIEESTSDAGVQLSLTMIDRLPVRQSPTLCINNSRSCKEQGKSIRQA